MDVLFRTLPNESEIHTYSHKTETSESALSYDIIEEHAYELDVVENVAYGAVSQQQMKDCSDMIYDTPHHDHSLMSGNCAASCGIGTNDHEIIPVNTNTAYGISHTQNVDPMNDDKDYW